jgi:hypothetical protein
VFAVPVVIIGLHWWEGPENSCRQVAARLRQEANLTLTVGDPASSVEAFLRKSGAEWTRYDFPSTKGFQGAVRNVWNPPLVDCAVTLKFDLDAAGTFERAEIIASYTLP